MIMSSAARHMPAGMHADMLVHEYLATTYLICRGRCMVMVLDFEHMTFGSARCSRRLSSVQKLHPRPAAAQLLALQLLASTSAGRKLHDWGKEGK